MLKLLKLQPLVKGLTNQRKANTLKFNPVPFITKASRHFGSAASRIQQEEDTFLNEIESAVNTATSRDSPRSYERQRSSDFGDLENDRFSRGRRDDYSRDSFSRGGFRENYSSKDSYSRSAREDVEPMVVEEKSNFDYSKYESVSVEIEGKGSEEAKAIETFEEMQLHPLLLNNIKRRNFQKPVVMQKYTIPLALKKRDLMMCAQTGSGKTAAFIFPIISQLLHEDTKGRHPKALIIAPTRELAQQIHAETAEFVKGTNLGAAVVFGGASSFNQISSLRSNPSIIIGTPGRIRDLNERGSLVLSSIKYLILDEADRMLDMGFEPQIREIVEASGMPARGQRQTMMFSATFPREIQTMAAEYMRDFLFLSFGKVGSATDTVKQHFILANDEREREKKLIEILLNHVKEEEGGVLVFFEQKRYVDEFEILLRRNHDLPVLGLHGDKSQQSRNYTLQSFAAGKCKVLLATSVASRGLDLKNVTHVVNLGLPRDMDDYVHRIGRTGRSGKMGKATTILTHADGGQIPKLKGILLESKQPVPEFFNQLGYGGSRFRSRTFGSRDFGRFSERDAPRRDSFGDRNRAFGERNTRESFVSRDRNARESFEITDRERSSEFSESEKPRKKVSLDQLLDSL